MIRIVLDKFFEIDGFDPDADFALTFQEATFEELTSREASFSVLISFAKTARNVGFFGPIDSFNFIGESTYRIYDCDVYDDEFLIFSGVFIPTESNHDFRGRVFGASAGLFESLKGLSIQDLDLSALNHTWTAANVNNNRSNTTGYVYPNINYGLWTGQTLPASGVDHTEFFPAVYVDDILEAACLQAGYTYNKLGSTLIVPFSKKDFYANKSLSNNQVESSTDQLVEVSSGVPEIAYVEFDIENLNPLDVFVQQTGGAKNYTTLSVLKGVYSCQMNFSYSASGSNVGAVNIQAYDTNNADVLDEVTVAVGASGTAELTFSFENVTILSLAQVVLRVNSANNGDVVTITGGATFTLVSGSQEIIDGSTIPVADTLPDLNCTDLFKYVAMKENALMITDNKAKTFEFLPFNDIADNFENALNWSDKIVDPENYKLEYRLSKYAQNNYLQYSPQPEDDPSRNRAEIGRGNLTIDDTALESSKILYRAPFSRTSFFPSFKSIGQMIYIPRYSTTSLSYLEADIEPEPRILEAVIDSTISIKIDGVSAPPTQCNPTQPVFQDAVDTNYSALSNSLNRCKLIEIDVQLSAVDIEIFDISKPVYLLNAYWFVRQIEQFVIGKQRATKVKLLKLY